MNGNNNEEPVRVFIHPNLLEELKLRKEQIEKEQNYPIKGGLPVVSKIAAEELKMIRLGKKGSIKVEFEKVKKEKKINLFTYCQ